MPNYNRSSEHVRESALTQFEREDGSQEDMKEWKTKMNVLIDQPK